MTPSTEGRTFYIMDACVVIDFVNAEKDILKLFAEFMGPLYIVSPVIEEINGIDGEKELVELGFSVIEPEIEDAYKAGESLGPLSFQDWICLLTAKRHGFICVTNDKKLREVCNQEGVRTLWGLGFIVELYKAGGITYEHAICIARKIHESNPKHISNKIFEKFKKDISSLGK
mgnify:CR=1 FL=1